MPLIALRPKKNKLFCENKFCCKRLIGPFKVLRRGIEGYPFYVCMACFNAIVKKGGPDKYLPGKQACFDISEAVNKDESSGAELHDATTKPYIPLGTHNLDGEVKIVTNRRTGQILL